MTLPSPWSAKDFSIVKRNGVYHLFFIRNNGSLPFAQTQKDLGHATSEDLYFWTQQPPVIPVRPGRFDNAHVWAPSIVERDGVYYMFYTGVRDSAGTHSYDQRTGIATSTDLYEWNRMDLPVHECGQVPWSWCDSTTATPFRDPFVMADPTMPGRWLMLYTGALSSDPEGMVVGMASSNGDFASWQDEGWLGITDRSITFSAVAESPHVFQHDGLWYLFFTSNSGQPLTFATTPDLFAPTGAWTYRGRLAQMLGYSTAGWIASEYFRDGLVEYFLYVNGNRIEINRMTWQPGDRFFLSQPDLFHVARMYWRSPAVRVGQAAELRFESKWATNRSASIESFWLDDDSVWHPIANGVLGLPDAIPLGGDLHDHVWLARALPDSLGAPVTPRIVVRLVDQTAVSNPIWLMPQVGGGGVDPPPEPTEEDGQGGARGLEEPEPVLRQVGRNMFAPTPALLVDLPEEVPARLDVFDLQGRRLVTLADRRLPKGATVLHWDGRDSSGRRAGRGLYFARLTTPGRTTVARLFVR